MGSTHSRFLCLVLADETHNANSHPQPTMKPRGTGNQGPWETSGDKSQKRWEICFSIRPQHFTSSKCGTTE